MAGRAVDAAQMAALIQKWFCRGFRRVAPNQAAPLEMVPQMRIARAMLALAIGCPADVVPRNRATVREVASSVAQPMIERSGMAQFSRPVNAGIWFLNSFFQKKSDRFFFEAFGF